MTLIGLPRRTAVLSVIPDPGGSARREGGDHRDDKATSLASPKPGSSVATAVSLELLSAPP
jgi:hypothetical protein